MTQKVKTTCPVCGKPSDFHAPPLGTFCSQRCKMVDLGRWLNEDFRISNPLPPGTLESEEEGG